MHGRTLSHSWAELHAGLYMHGALCQDSNITCFRTVRGVIQRCDAWGMYVGLEMQLCVLCKGSTSVLGHCNNAHWVQVYNTIDNCQQRSCKRVTLQWYWL
jgi:hypothetical protein